MQLSRDSPSFSHTLIRTEVTLLCSSHPRDYFKAQSSNIALPHDSLQLRAGSLLKKIHLLVQSLSKN